MSSHHCLKVVGVSIAFCAVRATPLSRPLSLAIIMSSIPWAKASDKPKPVSWSLNAWPGICWYRTGVPSTPEMTAAMSLPDRSSGPSTGSSSAYYEAIFASTHQRLSAYLSGQYAMDRADSAALAEDLLGRTVLPRLLRTLLNVEDVIKDMPEVEALARDIDLAAIRRLVSTSLPG